MISWTDPPPDLSTILRRTRDLKLAGMIYVCFLQDGGVQVAVQRGNDPNPGGAIDKDPLMALLRALGPEDGGSWAEHLQLNVIEPKAKPVRRKSKPAPPPPVEDDEDDWDVV